MVFFYTFESEHLSSFLNIFLPSLSVAKGANNTYYIYGSGGDGAGGYCFSWILQNSEIKTAIAYIPF